MHLCGGPVRRSDGDRARPAGRCPQPHDAQQPHTEGLLAYLRHGARFGQDPEDLWDAVSGANVISLTIGFNDTVTPSASAIPRLTELYQEKLDAVMAEIVALRAGKRTAIRVTNIYNNGGPSWTATVEAMNDVACEVAARYEAVCVDIYTAFNGADGALDPAALGLLGADATHPSQQGMEVIARTLAEAGYEPLE